MAEEGDDFGISWKEYKDCNAYLNELRDAIEERHIRYREIGSEKAEAEWQNERAEFKKIIFGPDEPGCYSYEERRRRFFQRRDLYSDLKINDAVSEGLRESIFELFCSHTLRALVLVSVSCCLVVDNYILDSSVTFTQGTVVRYRLGDVFFINMF